MPFRLPTILAEQPKSGRCRCADFGYGGRASGQVTVNLSRRLASLVRNPPKKTSLLCNCPSSPKPSQPISF